MPRQGSLSLQSPCRVSVPCSSRHSSWSRQVAADDRIFTKGNHDGISVYPLQQVDKSLQMGFPSELEAAGFFLPRHKYLSSTWWKCQEHPAARNSCPPAQSWEQDGTGDTAAQPEVLWAVVERCPTLLGARGGLQCVRVGEHEFNRGSSFERSLGALRSHTLAKGLQVGPRAQSRFTAGSETEGSFFPGKYWNAVLPPRSGSLFSENRHFPEMVT